MKLSDKERYQRSTVLLETMARCNGKIDVILCLFETLEQMQKTTSQEYEATNKEFIEINKY